MGLSKTDDNKDWTANTVRFQRAFLNGQRTLRLIAPCAISRYMSLDEVELFIIRLEREAELLKQMSVPEQKIQTDPETVIAS